MSTGDRKNDNKLRWRNFPLFLIEPVVEVGAKAEKHKGNPEGKYETFNFLKGLKMNDTLDSLKRHLMKFESPYSSDLDEESQCNHLAHIAWNALVALHMLKTRPDLDDRYKLPEKEEKNSWDLDCSAGVESMRKEIAKRGKTLSEDLKDYKFNMDAFKDVIGKSIHLDNNKFIDEGAYLKALEQQKRGR